MKIRLVILIFIALLCLCSCTQKDGYELMHPQNEISYIAIVSISINENVEIEQTELQIINNTSAFLKEFRNVSCYTWWGDPMGLTEDDHVIKIVYQNGEYELIAWNGQAEYQMERGFRNYRGYNMFDEGEFKLLISRYNTKTVASDGS